MQVISYYLYIQKGEKALIYKIQTKSVPLNTLFVYKSILHISPPQHLSAKLWLSTFILLVEHIEPRETPLVHYKFWFFVHI